MVMLSRRDYYPRYNREAPPVEIPDGVEHLWVWYMDITRRVRRVVEGVCSPIPPTEWLAWQKLTGNIVRSWEYEMLAAMDVAFCDEMNNELEARRAAEREEADERAKRK